MPAAQNRLDSALADLHDVQQEVKSHFTPIGGVFGLGLGLLVAALVRE